MHDEITRRTQDKFEAAIHRKMRQPLAYQIQQEHLADLGMIQKQAERRYNNGQHKTS